MPTRLEDEISKNLFSRVSPRDLHWETRRANLSDVLWLDAISYPESSGFLVRGRASGETLGYWNEFLFLIDREV